MHTSYSCNNPLKFYIKRILDKEPQEEEEEEEEKESNR
jgi:hypothetical protein